MRAQLVRAIRWLLGFFEVHASQSMTRALALLFGATGSGLALAAYHLAHRPRVTPEHVQMVHALSTFAALFVGGGAVALLTRSKPAATLPQDGGV